MNKIEEKKLIPMKNSEGLQRKLKNAKADPIFDGISRRFFCAKNHDGSNAHLYSFFFLKYFYISNLFCIYNR